MRVTLKDVAERTGFEASTVSRVLSGDKRCYASQESKRIIREAAKELDYTPNCFARALRQRRSNMVGIVGGFFNSEVNGYLMSGVTEALQAHGYGTIMIESRPSFALEEQALRELRARRVDGILFHSGLYGSKSAQYIPADIPCVVHSAEKVPGHPWVMTDRAAGVRKAVERLVELGHRRIAFVAPSIEGTEQKRAGYMAALRDAGLPDETQVHVTGSETGLVREYLMRHRAEFKSVTAIICSNDLMAIEAMFALKALGLEIPHDCSVIGHDDISTAGIISPQLTTLRQPRDAMRNHSVDMLVRLMKGEKVPNVTLVPEFIERESIGPCRQA